MYTVEKLKKEIREASGKRKKMFVTAKFVDGAKEVITEFDFPLYLDGEGDIDVRLKQYAEELYAGDVLDSAITLGPLDLSTVDTTTPADIIARADWNKKRQTLIGLNQFIALLNRDNAPAKYDAIITYRNNLASEVLTGAQTEYLPDIMPS